jgi:hypothetical protein
MTRLERRAFVLACAATAAAAAPIAMANGDLFFAEAVEIPGKTEFVYFGAVKSADGGYLADVIVSIEASDPRLSYEAYTNVIGRYRSPDIGRAIVDLGYEVDASKIQVTVFKKGYRTIRRMYRGKARQNKGAVEMDFTMQLVPAAP